MPEIICGKRLASLLMVVSLGLAIPGNWLGSAWGQAAGGGGRTGDQAAQRGSGGNQQALAVYADAANFQNNGELALASEQWEKFLKEFPNEPLASQAAHYLGVCQMQLAEPNYGRAAEAFEQALRNKKHELREESLSNLGWCLYALGNAGEVPDAANLRRAVAAFQTLLKEFPKTPLADRALFYQGESLYGLGQSEQAVAAYDAMLKSPAGQKSSLRADAMYSKGVALEELKRYDRAIGVYRGLLSQHTEDRLVGTVRLRLAEVLVLEKDYAEAERLLAEVIAEGESEDLPLAISRRAFVLAQLGRGEEAAALYERLVAEFPASPWAASANMAAAQSLFRAGNLVAAAAKFRTVLDAQADRATATEAAHWLAVIALGKGQAAEANKFARDQIAKGVDGPYALALQLDAAEARSLLEGEQAAALTEFEALIKRAANDPLLPRILYNAAFTALQLGQPARVLELTDNFAARYADSPLVADISYLQAEAYLQSGQPAEAISAYDRLLAAAAADNPQLPLWTLRAATANFAAKKYDGAIGLLEKSLPTLPKANWPEAFFLIGNSHVAAGRPDQAIKAYQRGLKDNPQGPRSDEMMFRMAAAQVANDDLPAATQTWQRIIAEFSGSPIADQARYRLAQNAADAGQIERAIELYDQLLSPQADPVLRPYALYGKGWSLLQEQRHQEAIAPLSDFIDQFDQHPLRAECILARGMCHRRLAALPAATADFQAFLEMQPSGDNLGHGLYELALIDRQQSRPREAVQNLRRIVADVPAYPALDDVLYELAAVQRELSENEAAIAAYEQLVKRFPESRHASEASYYVGQAAYAERDWAAAERAYLRVSQQTEDKALLEKSLYRLGWTYFQQTQHDQAAATFQEQASRCPEGNLHIDALMMIGESHFAKADYQAALTAYEQARQQIITVDGENRRFADDAEKRVRELVFLHGGQSAGQLKRFDEALQWYDQMRNRYPASDYLPQVYYETGFAFQQLKKTDEAVKFFIQAANNNRNESAARARFMLGEILFEKNELDKAINEFKKVMYGFGAEQAAEPIRDWQAKSGFEAGRCAELLVQRNNGEQRRQAIELAVKYYGYVIETHSQHALAARARERIDVLKRL
ncbi:tetratricopeptide repeat protein [Planctomycetaceae bacterium SH139]